MATAVAFRLFYFSENSMFVTMYLCWTIACAMLGLVSAMQIFRKSVLLRRWREQMMILSLNLLSVSSRHAVRTSTPVSAPLPTADASSPTPNDNSATDFASSNATAFSTCASSALRLNSSCSALPASKIFYNDSGVPLTHSSNNTDSSKSNQAEFDDNPAEDFKYDEEEGQGTDFEEEKEEEEEEEEEQQQQQDDGELEEEELEFIQEGVEEEMDGANERNQGQEQEEEEESGDAALFFDPDGSRNSSPCSPPRYVSFSIDSQQQDMQLLPLQEKQQQQLPPPTPTFHSSTFRQSFQFFPVPSQLYYE